MPAENVDAYVQIHTAPSYQECFRISEPSRATSVTPGNWPSPENLSFNVQSISCNAYGRHISGQIIAVDGNTETLYPRS